MKVNITWISFLFLNCACILSCVQQTHLKTVTFEVDLNGMKNISAVGLRGNFTSPPWEVTLPLTDKDNNGIFELTLSKSTAQNEVAFKFVDQDDRFESDCQPNRVITFEYRPETITYSTTFDQLDGKQVLKDHE